VPRRPCLRPITGSPGLITLRDVSQDGRALITHDSNGIDIWTRAPGASSERDLSWLDWSRLRDLSPDGRTVLLGRHVVVPSLTMSELLCKMSYMGNASISIRELQRNLKRVMAQVERGQVIEVTRRRRPIARLAPMHTAIVAPWPDLDERARSVFRDRLVTPGASEVVIESRGDR
jgi:prevent-host-death family protein